MEEPDSLSTTHASVFRHILRYYTAIQLLTSANPRLRQLISFYQCLQFATLLIPPTDAWEVPWNYSVFWPLWFALNCVARTDYLLTVVLRDSYIVVLACIGLVALRTLSAGICIALYAQMGRTQFQNFVVASSPSLWKRSFVAVDRFCCLLFSQVLTVSWIAFLASVLSCGNPEMCLTEGDVRTNVLIFVSLPLALCLVLCDRVATSELMWQRGTNSVISPKQALILALFDEGTAFLLGGMHFAQRKTQTLGVAAILGAAKLVYVCKRRPYHTRLFNTAAAFQGAFLLCESLLLCVSLFLDASGLMPSMSLFLVAPMLSCFLYSRLKIQAAKLKSGRQRSKLLQERTLRLLVFSNTFSQADPRSIGAWTKHSQTVQLLWSAYFYLAKDDLFCMKLLIAELSDRPTDFLGRVAAAVCVKRLKSRLETHAEEKVVMDFLRLTSLQDKVCTQDYESTLKLRSFYEKLLHRYVSFGDLVIAAQSVTDSLKKTLSTYQKIISHYRRKKFLLQAYCSLLETLGKWTEAAKCRHQMNKIVNPQKHHIVQGVDFLQFDDPKSVLFIVQCSGVGAGLILWSENAAVLGYPDEEIRGMDFTKLVPEAFRARHQDIFSEFLHRKEMPQTLKKPINLYFVTQQNQLVFGLWRVLLANLEPSGHLALVVVFRTGRSPREFAVVTEDDKLQEQTIGFERFRIETEFEKQARFSEERIWSGVWRKQEIYVARDTWNAGTQFSLPVITLYKQKAQKPLRQTLAHVCLASSSSISSLLKQTSFTIEQFKVAQKTTNFTLATTSCGGPKYTYTRAIMSQSRPYMQILLASTTAAFMLCILLNLLLTNQVSSQHFILNQNIGELQSLRMRTNSVLSSMRSKELFLLNAGYCVFTNEEKSRSDLMSLGTQLNEMAGYLIGNASRQTGFFRSLLLDPLLPYWKYELDAFKLYHMSLINIMADMATHAIALSAVPLKNVTTTNSDFMTLYRNGAVEAMHAFNLSVKVFADQKDEERTEMNESLKGLLLVFIVVQTFLSLVLTLPLMLCAERWRRHLWKLILHMPRPLLVEMLNRIYERLMCLREIEETPFSSESSSFQMLKASNEYAMSSPMKKLFATIFVFLLFINCSVFLVYFVGISENEDILASKPKYIHWAGLRRVIPWLSMYYMRESFLPANLSFSQIIKDTQMPYSPMTHWKQAISELNYLHHCLTYSCPESNLDKLFLSDAEKNLLLGDACVNCSAYSRYGLTPLVHEFLYGELAAYSALSGGNTSYSLSKLLEKEVSLVGPLLLDAVKQYDNETVSLLQEAERMTMVVSVAFIAAGLLLLAAVVAPLLWKNADLLRRELQILKNIESIEVTE